MIFSSRLTTVYYLTVWGLVSGVLINNKVWEREQFEDLIRWAGSTLQKWNHQLKKRLEGGKDTSRTRALAASYRCPGSQCIYTASQLLWENAVLQTPREGVCSASAKMWRARHPVSHICKRNFQGLSLGNAATEARQGRQGVTKTF